MGIDRDIWDAIEAGSPPDRLEDEMFELISAYVDGEASPKERRLVEAYLAENRLGQEVISDIRMTASCLHPKLEETPNWLEANILLATSQKPKLPWISPVFRFAAPIAAAVVGLAFYISPSSSGPDLDSIVNRGVKKNLKDVENQPFVIGEKTVADAGLGNQKVRMDWKEAKGSSTKVNSNQPEVKKPVVSTVVKPDVKSSKPAIADLNPGPSLLPKESGGTSKIEPKQPDAVSMVGEVEDGPATEEKPAKKEDDSIVRLRERLKQVNSGAIDLGGAVSIPKNDR